MDGNFDMLTMSYPAPPLQQAIMPVNEPLVEATATPGLMGLDGLDHTSNFDVETFAGSEDLAFSQHGMAGGMPSMRRQYSTYDADQFSDIHSTYDQQMAHEIPTAQEPSIERGHKLLSFSVPSYSYHLLDYAYRRTTLSLTAQLHGMFFLAESPWAATSDATAPLNELTCYRRNLFQISGQLMLPRGLRYILNEANQQVPIMQQMELTISATESVENNPVKIISVPWKTPAAGQPVVEDKSEKEPPSIPIDLMNGQEIDGEFTSFPINWKRLQFRIATANNGRRKELQQHFVIHMKLMATLADQSQSKVVLCEVTSGAIIVRGRSPRNFQSRKDIAISQSGGSIRNRSSHHPTSGANQHMSRHSNTGSNVSLKQQEPPNSAPLQMPPNPFDYDSPDLQFSPNFFNEWKSPGSNSVGLNQNGGAMTAAPPDYHVGFNANLPTGVGYARSSPDLMRQPPNTSAPRSTPAAPIGLSLTDDDLTPASTGPGVVKPAKISRPSSASPSETHAKSRKINHILASNREVPASNSMPAGPGSVLQRPPSFSLGFMSSPDESADLLYEYFPLSINDWMPPVDAVYRPHVVHHLNVPQDGPGAIFASGAAGGAMARGAGTARGRSKRYFSEDTLA